VIDTLKIAKRLEQAQLSSEQAEAIAESIAEVTSAEFATRADLKELELQLVKSIDDVKDQLTNRINVILWAVCGFTGITWILQIFGAAIRHFFGQP
jgi:hypothetical protein